MSYHREPDSHSRERLIVHYGLLTCSSNRSSEYNSISKWLQLDSKTQALRKGTLNHLETLSFWTWIWIIFFSKILEAKNSWLYAKSLSVRLRTKWLWIRVKLQSLKLQISRLLRARSSLTFSVWMSKNSFIQL